MWLLMIVAYMAVGICPQLYAMGLVRLNIDSYRLNYVILPTISIILILSFARWYIDVIPSGRNRDKKLAVLWAFYFAAIMIVLEMAAGIFIDDLGRNPYDTSIIGILKNMYYAIPVLILRENVRSYIINSSKHYKAAFMLMLLCTAVAGVNLPGMMQLEGTEEIVVYVMQYILPVVVEGILLNLMSVYGGAIPGIVYLIMLETMKWIFPVTPVLNWLTKTVIYAGVGGVLILVLTDQISECAPKRRKKSKKPEKLFGQIAVMTVCVLMIWFFVGVFSVYPSVVLTGSMEPKIKPGDMILIDKIKDEKEISRLKEGDIITFNRDDIVITHRIVEVKKDSSGNISFKTKGDNNSAEDTREVKADEVLGKCLGTVPKVGLPILWIKGGRNSAPKGVEF